jgi:hypothetical protein
MLLVHLILFAPNSLEKIEEDPIVLRKNMNKQLMGVVILTCTISTCNHCLIFWTLDFENNNNNKLNNFL